MNDKRNGGIWIGGLLILFGVLLLADNFDILYHLSPGYFFHRVRFFSWSFIMFIVGAVILTNNSRSIVGWILLVIGGIHFASNLFRFSIGNFIGDFWPLILIGIGLIFILKKREPRTLHFEHRTCHDSDPSQKYTERQANSHSGDEVDIVAVFNTIKRRIVSQNFTGGRISVLFGGVDLYITDSTLAPGEQTLDISCIFGGVDIYVPKDWRVIVKTATVFGGFDDSRFQGGTTNTTEDRVLVIKGFILFGGGDIKNG